jgi:predicted nucleic acid-binding protein
MEIVVDTNIMISALLKDNLTRRILLLSPFDMYTLAYAQKRSKSISES